jgi:hypothetical protein
MGEFDFFRGNGLPLEEVLQSWDGVDADSGLLAERGEECAEQSWYHWLYYKFIIGVGLFLGLDLEERSSSED